jgi:hypothetical protein
MYQYNIDISYKDDESYQAAFLSLFDLKEFDNDVIQETVDELYETIKHDKDWMNLLRETTGKHLLSYEVDPVLGITILLSYDYLDVFHVAIQQHHLKTPLSLESIHKELEKK